MTMLHRYWLKFVRSAEPSILNLGCGITALDRDDAMRIFKNDVVPIYGNREIFEIIEDADISALDEHHVIPNMGIPTNRGVWFPRL